MEVLKSDYQNGELEQVAEAANVDGFVAVQARQDLVENEDLLAITTVQPLIKGVVGWVPLADQRVADVLDCYAANSLFKGVRHVVHDEPDDDFILRPDFNRGVAQLLSRDLVYDILIFAKHLDATIQFVDRHPDQPMVLDHIAKPTILRAEFDESWAKSFRRLAERCNVTCKFSGVVTEVRDPEWSIETIRPYWDTAIEAFTPQRMMFGSDWPVCLLKTGHARWVETVRQLAGELSADEQSDLFANTAVKAYNLSV